MPSGIYQLWAPYGARLWCIHYDVIQTSEYHCSFTSTKLYCIV